MSMLHNWINSTFEGCEFRLSSKGLIGEFWPCCIPGAYRFVYIVSQCIKSIDSMLAAIYRSYLTLLPTWTGSDWGFASRKVRFWQSCSRLWQSCSRLWHFRSPAQSHRGSSVLLHGSVAVSLLYRMVLQWHLCSSRGLNVLPAKVTFLWTECDTPRFLNLFCCKVWLLCSCF